MILSLLLLQIASDGVNRIDKWLIIELSATIYMNANAGTRIYIVNAGFMIVNIIQNPY